MFNKGWKASFVTPQKKLLTACQFDIHISFLIDIRYLIFLDFLKLSSKHRTTINN